MNTALSNPKIQMLIFWSKWVLATSIAWLIIVIIFIRRMDFLYDPTEYKYTGVGVKLQTFIIIGAVLGVLQWLALIGHIRYAWLWVIATISGVVLGVLISGAFNAPNNLLIDLAIIFTPVSIFQTLVLNISVPGAWRWMPIKAVGFLTSFLFTVFGGMFLFLFLPFIFGECIGIPFAAVTGLGLVWMIGKTRPISESIPQPVIAKPILVKTRVLLIGLVLIISVPLISWLGIRWDANERALIDRSFGPAITKGGRILSKELVHDLAFSPDSNILAYSNRKNLIIYDIKQNKPEKIQFSSSGALDFSPDGSLLAANENGKVILWDMKTKQRVGIPMVADSIDILSIVFSPDGKLLVTAGHKGGVLIWDIVTYQSYDPSLKGNLVAFSPDGKTLVIGSYEDKSIIFWDVITHQQFGSPIIDSSDYPSFFPFTISPNGQILATGGGVKLWDMASHKLLNQQLEGQSLSAECLAFSPDGKVLASGLYDGSIVLWDILTFKSIGSRLTGHSHSLGVHYLAFSPDGKYLVSSSRDEKIILWDMSVILH